VKGIWRRALLLGAVASLAVCGSAQAQIGIGALPAEDPGDTCLGGPFDIAQQSVAPGVTYRVPVDGVLTSWSTRATNLPGQVFTLKLVSPFESGYVVHAHDGARSLVPGQVNTFRTLLPVQEGDELALSSTGGPSGCAFFSEEPGDVIVFNEEEPDTPDGQRWQPAGTTEEFLLNVAATILPPPRIRAISVTQGSVAGGTPVVVTGENFAEVRSVAFSGIPVSYSVASEGQLTAVAPPNTALTSRTIEVTTAAGRDNAPQTFNYIGCAVPNLRKATLKEAKSELQSAGCALGKIKRLKKASLKKGKVSRQSPAAGAILPPGTQVSVTPKGKPRKKRKKKH
jgi:hypothetical protein